MVDRRYKPGLLIEAFMLKVNDLPGSLLIIRLCKHPSKLALPPPREPWQHPLAGGGSQQGLLRHPPGQR